MCPRQTMSKQVYRTLKKRIITKQLAQRDRLSESQLSQELEVSRTPIREALKMLEQEGLVSRDSLGLYVTALTREQVINLYSVRNVLEKLAAEEAARKCTGENCGELKKIIEQMSNYSESEDITVWIEINDKFHRNIAAMTGNSYLNNILNDLRIQLSLVRSNSLLAATRSPESLKEHIAIGEAILNRNPDLAGKAAEAHARSATEFALKNLFL